MSATTENEATNEYGPKAYRDEAVLRELYHEEGLTQYEIAERLDCSRSTVWKWMKRTGVATRKPTHASDYPACYYTDKRGYERWQTEVDGDKRHVSVHRLVAVAEYGIDTVDGMDIHHKNKIPWDNRAVNLELMTPSEHAQHHS